MRHADKIRRLCEQLNAAGIDITRQEVADFVAATEGKIADPARAQEIIETFVQKTDKTGTVVEKKLTISETLAVLSRLRDKIDIVCPPRPYADREVAGEICHACNRETPDEFTKRTGFTIAQVERMTDAEIAKIPDVPCGYYPDRECMFDKQYQMQKEIIRSSLTRQAASNECTFFERGPISTDAAQHILERMKDAAWDLGKERRGEYGA